MVVPETADAPGRPYVDLHLVHEATAPQAFLSEIESRGLKVRRPDRTFRDARSPTPTDLHALTSRLKRRPKSRRSNNCARHGITLVGNSGDRGVVYVRPELVSHSEQLSYAAIATRQRTVSAPRLRYWHLRMARNSAMQCLLQRKLKRMRVTVDGCNAASPPRDLNVLRRSPPSALVAVALHVIEYVCHDPRADMKGA